MRIIDMPKKENVISKWMYEHADICKYVMIGVIALFHLSLFGFFREWLLNHGFLTDTILANSLLFTIFMFAMGAIIYSLHRKYPFTELRQRMVFFPKTYSTFISAFIEMDYRYNYPGDPKHVKQFYITVCDKNGVPVLTKNITREVNEGQNLDGMINHISRMYQLIFRKNTVSIEEGFEDNSDVKIESGSRIKPENKQTAKVLPFKQKTLQMKESNVIPFKPPVKESKVIPFESLSKKRNNSDYI